MPHDCADELACFPFRRARRPPAVLAAAVHGGFRAHRHCLCIGRLSRDAVYVKARRRRLPSAAAVEAPHHSLDGLVAQGVAAELLAVARALRHVPRDELLRAGRPGQLLQWRQRCQLPAAAGVGMRHAEGRRVLLLCGALREVPQGLLRPAAVREDLGPRDHLGDCLVLHEQYGVPGPGARLLCALGRRDVLGRPVLHGEDRQHDVPPSGAGLAPEEHRRGVGRHRHLHRLGHSAQHWQVLRALSLPARRPGRCLGEGLPDLAGGKDQEAVCACGSQGRQARQPGFQGHSVDAGPRHGHDDVRGCRSIAARRLLWHARRRVSSLREHTPH
mmetsp:Transcript_98586/g.287613  ORF Transcript_98586/g.287613 Transcript_98586/m.287613 type:complete len:330 (+) Transcript_98586:314-1303(+)